MKKIILPLLAGLMIFVLCSCSPEPINDTPPDMMPSAYPQNLSYEPHSGVYRGEGYEIEDDLVWRTGDSYNVALL